jgi:hypothetical protein
MFFYSNLQVCHPPEGTPLRDGVSAAKDLLPGELRLFGRDERSLRVT